MRLEAREGQQSLRPLRNEQCGGINGAGAARLKKKKAKSEDPHAHSAFGAPKFVFGRYLWATQPGPRPDRGRRGKLHRHQRHLSR
jgi:hypothetical protein